jgi:hypothetical protein
MPFWKSSLKILILVSNIVINHRKEKYWKEENNKGNAYIIKNISLSSFNKLHIHIIVSFIFSGYLVFTLVSVITSCWLCHLALICITADII